MVDESIGSFFIGTLGLLVLLAISLIVAVSRVAPRSIVSFKSIALLAIGFHLVHFTEEAVYGFHRLFPELLGLVTWPLWLFLSFNFVWVGVWLIGIFVDPPNRITMTTFWFLGLASTVNAIAHPIFSFLVAGYFPGLVSSPFVGVLGILLLRRLNRASSNGKLPGAAA